MEFNTEEFNLLKNKDKKQFERLFNFYYKDIYNYLLIKTRGDKMISEEILSDTFYSAYKSINTLKGNKYINYWLLRIAFRRLQDYLRKKYKEEKYNEVLYSKDRDNTEIDNKMDKEIQEKEKILIIRTAINNLKENYKKVILLKFFNNMTVIDISKKLNINQEACKSLLRRAKKAFKNEIMKVENKLLELL